MPVVEQRGVRREALLAAKEDGTAEAAHAADLASQTNGHSPDVETLRGELQAALNRESVLRATVDAQIETTEQGLDLDEALSARAAELDEREAELRRFESEVTVRRSELEADTDDTEGRDT